MAAPSLHLDHARKFVDACRRFDVEPPKALIRGLEVDQTAKAIVADAPPADVLTMTPDEIHAHLSDLSIRRFKSISDGTGLLAGLYRFNQELQQQMRQEAIPELDRIVTALQPRFAKIATVLVSAATEHGLTADTTAEQVLNRDDDRVAKAWRDAQQASADIRALVDFRIQISTLFTVSPTLDELADAYRREHGGDHRRPLTNYSVAFAAGDNWSAVAGFQTFDIPGHLDWYAMARGGLRLNTPTDVARKLDGQRAEQHRALSRLFNRRKTQEA